MFKIENVKAQPIMTHQLDKDVNGKERNKLIILNVSGKSWIEKRDIIREEILKVYGNIPEGLSFIKRKTKQFKTNPDGLRLFIYCSWLKRNRFYDMNGLFKLGTLIKAINKQIEGKTKKRLLINE